jgi:hypothetical protein
VRVSGASPSGQKVQVQLEALLASLALDEE